MWEDDKKRHGPRTRKPHVDRSGVEYQYKDRYEKRADTLKRISDELECASNLSALRHLFALYDLERLDVLITSINRKYTYGLTARQVAELQVLYAYLHTLLERMDALPH